MSDRCTGHCCQRFTLHSGPDYFWEEYRRWVEQVDDGKPYVTDIHLIAPMLIYLGVLPVEVDEAIDPIEDYDDEGNVKAHHSYTCKHFDRATGNCGIYEHRPEMCRDYPYDSGCNYARCTWEEKRRDAES